MDWAARSIEDGTNGKPVHLVGRSGAGHPADDIDSHEID